MLKDNGLWWYQEFQFEAGLIDRLVREGFESNQYVDYALNFAKPKAQGTFRKDFESAQTLELRSNGYMEIFVDEVFLAAAEGSYAVELQNNRSEVQVIVKNRNSDSVALSEVSCSPDDPWFVLEVAGNLSRAQKRRGGTRAPHLVDEPITTTTMERVLPGLFRLEFPALGRPVLYCEARPEIVVGESKEEALSDLSTTETVVEVIALQPGVWTTKNRVASLYLRVVGESPAQIDFEEHRRCGELHGAFASSDNVLNRIWQISANTLALTRQGLLMDGIKRDRMPWAGDHALVVHTNAYTYFDAEIMADSLTSLGQPEVGFVNGIADYSLWWVIASNQYRRYFGEDEHVIRTGPMVNRMLLGLQKYVSSDGIFRPVADPSSFPPAGPTATFLDWGVEVDQGVDLTALQILYCWALEAGAEFLSQSDPDSAQTWSAKAILLRDIILKSAWNRDTNEWIDQLNHGQGLSFHANILGQLSGLNPMNISFIQADNAGSSTPFMEFFRLLALGEAKHRYEAVQELRTRWGVFVENGSATAWEDFGGSGESDYEMYGRPFGKSLSHGWGSGPAALLPILIFGAKPLSAGWETFTVEVDLVDLEWASATVPTPLGLINMWADTQHLKVSVEGVNVLQIGGQSWRGPGEFSFPRAS
ncbi:hypothetical protein V5R04_11900 [Jonesiaceae bacterium BS-20]|uniref:Alpha-L-rhamnosidase six-hairpin glycosidase domain-containing protein n=1 Tax=Jonesiaceae bacterium BS-20 TaxID=3120821 RepID=A0AAU7DV17_9MICO